MQTPMRIPNSREAPINMQTTPTNMQGMNSQTPMNAKQSRGGLFSRLPFIGGGAGGNKETVAEQRSVKKAEKMFAKAKKAYDKGDTKRAQKYENKANTHKTNAKTAAEARQKDFEASRRIDGELQRLGNPSGPVYVDPEEQKKKESGKGERGTRKGTKPGEADKKAGEADKKAGEADKKAGDVQKGESEKKAGEAEKNAGEAQKKVAEGKPAQAAEKADKADQKASEAEANPSASHRASENANDASQRAVEAQNASEQNWRENNLEQPRRRPSWEPNNDPEHPRHSSLLVGYESPNGKPRSLSTNGMFTQLNPVCVPVNTTNTTL